MINQPTIEISRLDFAYETSSSLVLHELDMTLTAGMRCLLVGANGAGKTTLLSIIAGRHMIANASVRVLGRAAFDDTSLTQDVSFIGGVFPLDVDITVEEMLAHRPEVDAARRESLINMLGIDRRWHMNRVSDGQRKRVQILLGLIKPCAVLLLDEATSDLDLIARVRLLAFLKRESHERSTTILYATHILDVMEQWATHISFITDGRIRYLEKIEEIKELNELREGGVTAPLHNLVRHWLLDAAGPSDQ